MPRDLKYLAPSRLFEYNPLVDHLAYRVQTDWARGNPDSAICLGGIACTHTSHEADLSQRPRCFF
jgi:hypothetical protein